MMKNKYESPAIQTIEIETDRLMSESPVTGDIIPVPWTNDNFSDFGV